jgi:tetratricopeptide (TPR) repeat protein
MQKIHFKIGWSGWIVFLLAVSSCQKNFLNKAPLAQYSDENVWKDSALISRFVDGIYANIICVYDYPGNNYGYLNQGFLPADLTDEGKSNFQGIIANQINLGQYTSASNVFDHIWSYPDNTQTGVYENVRNCNLFLSHLGDMPLAATTRRQLTGEVLFLRAYNYQFLYSIFGRFPIIDSVLNIGDGLNKPRGSDADCVAFILKDLDSAASILPTQYAGADLGKVTRGAALGMQCRLLLNQKRYQEAAAAAQAVMNLNIYQLFPDYAAMFYPDNDDNSEVIFNKEYGGDLSGQVNLMDVYENSSFFTGFTGSPEDAPTQNMVDQYLMKDGLPWDQSPLYDPAHPYANRDPRLAASILYDGATWLGNVMDMQKGSAYNPSTGGGTVTGYMLRKFLNPNHNFNSNNTNYQNCIILRLAEIYLNYAECELQLGNAEEARKYVNMLRERPGVNMPDIPAGQMTWDTYVRERTVELAFEGERWADIRRWDMGAQLIGATIYGMTIQTVGSARVYTRSLLETRYFDPKMYLFPIPLKELNKYPAGQVLEQNPGW